MSTHTSYVLGLMSGSSLDGLDMALCRFDYELEPQFRLLDWKLEAADTQAYPAPWQARLRQGIHLPGRELWRLHVDFGQLSGQYAKRFLDQQAEHDCSLAGSHGHTLFHGPEQGFTTQIGDGAALAARLGLPCVTELRSADVALGGQGAPIAPIADLMLFADYDAFLNLGGIANISVTGSRTDFGTSAGREQHATGAATSLAQRDSGTDPRKSTPHILAGDVSGANQILDRLARQIDRSLSYDPAGRYASAGQFQSELAAQVNALPYHHRPYPKSLDNAWVVDQLWPLIDRFEAAPADKAHTFCRWLAEQIHRDILQLVQQAQLPAAPLRVLVTGGGARNDFMMDCLRRLDQDDRHPLGYFVADPPALGDFKEAAMVALMALLRQLGLPNALASATGAATNSINGALYLPSTSRPHA